jgi:hypothetical protein
MKGPEYKPHSDLHLMQINMLALSTHDPAAVGNSFEDKRLLT